MIINKDFKEFLELLNKNKVKYLIVGGPSEGDEVKLFLIGDNPDMILHFYFIFY